MTDMATASQVPPPWNTAGFFSEADLRQVQEYYFQTHATHSRLVAEGRNAQGFMKSMVRRKLTQQMGEDFRMYTGAAIGEAQDGESQGIRGELNYLLRHIYQRVAPKDPITSPTQEDLTILKHPHGALEVCYGMTCYYTTLLKRHATLAGNRRKVLKSILDEELFKWVWRMCLGYLLSDAASKSNWNDAYLVTGLPYVPVDRQKANISTKLFDLGQFLLGKAIGESHLRFPLCYYFVTFIRNVQFHLVTQPGAALDQVYAELVQRAPESPVDHPLIAVDVLTNMFGNSGQSFDDIFKEQQDIQKFIPPQELEFILQFDLQSNQHNVVNALRGMIPQFNREEITEQGRASLMPLVLMLRTVPPGARAVLLEKLPIPVMMMVRNRTGNGPQDEKARNLLTELKQAMEERAKKGESLQVRAVNRAGMSGVATVGTPPAKPEPPAAKPASAPAARPAPRPAMEAQAAPRPAPAAQTGAAKAPAAAPSMAAQAESPVILPPITENLLDVRLLVAWRMDGAHLEVRTLSVREMANLAGREPLLYVPWVLIAVQTGQIFPGAPQASKEVLEKLVVAVVTRIPTDIKARLTGSQAQNLAGQSKSLSPQKFLLAIIAKAVQADAARNAGALAAPLASLCEKFQANLPDFLRNPSKDDYRDQRVALTVPEKNAVAVLQKVARLQ